jgi:hypothetical protein
LSFLNIEKCVNLFFRMLEKKVFSMKLFDKLLFVNKELEMIINTQYDHILVIYVVLNDVYSCEMV